MARHGGGSIGRSSGHGGRRSGASCGLQARRRGYRSAVFVFFSNRLGCGGSLLLSLAVTLLLLLLMGVIRL